MSSSPSPSALTSRRRTANPDSECWGLRALVAALCTGTSCGDGCCSATGALPQQPPSHCVRLGRAATTATGIAIRDPRASAPSPSRGFPTKAVGCRTHAVSPSNGPRSPTDHWPSGDTTSGIHRVLGAFCRPKVPPLHLFISFSVHPTLQSATVPSTRRGSPFIGSGE